ncbi:hypothetical protein [Laribacter hongkongensis]|nr:hypothetical protein [Laribacter hongkongensis]MCG9041655.1 hypothetical protein [Laribacter hongkongensis]MCG9067228.1 hypothetical protein [Laribacter hongkongensis]MCG9110433.1 hypothetical protein [Laribacter hongkongensis]MCG9122380.1 hypothetical protein [Laribacter hongkongensis]
MIRFVMARSQTVELFEPIEETLDRIACFDVSRYQSMPVRRDHCLCGGWIDRRHQGIARQSRSVQESPRQRPPREMSAFSPWVSGLPHGIIKRIDFGCQPATQATGHPRFCTPAACWQALTQ